MCVYVCVGNVCRHFKGLVKVFGDFIRACTRRKKDRFPRVIRLSKYVCM